MIYVFWFGEEELFSILWFFGGEWRFWKTAGGYERAFALVPGLVVRHCVRVWY